MGFFSNILEKIKKPVEALKNFLTPKEQRTMKFEVGEGLTPEERVKAEATVKKTSASDILGYAPYKSSGRETFAQLIGEGQRESTVKESVVQFGKDVLRAGPRAAASVMLDTQKRKTMTPETKVEKFLLGKEPIESVSERIERFPERAKEFGLSEPAAKKIAPFAVIGLTAMDIIPPLPGKSALKSAGKKALASKTAKQFIKTLSKKESKEILKSGFKSVDDFFRIAKNQKSAVAELKTAARMTPTQELKQILPKKLESIGRFITGQNLGDIPGVNRKNILKMQVFGSSVEGKAKPRDVDIFVTVKDGVMKFNKKAGLISPKVVNKGKFQYFIMPESQSRELLDAMLYTGRKDQSRLFSGKAVNVPRSLYSAMAKDSEKAIQVNSGLKPTGELKAITKTTTPVFEHGEPVATSVVRQAQKGFESTDKFRGGTWYSTPESKNFDFTGIGPKAERGVGGPKKIEATLNIKKPFVIKDAIPEDGSFGVINSGYENFLPAKHQKLGNELYERVFGEHGLTSQELGVKEMKWANQDILIDTGKKFGLAEARAKAVAQSSNGFDAMMDLIVSDGLRQKGYDALILENRIKSGEVVDRHIFKFAEAEKVKPTAELKEILKGKPAAPAKAQEVISEYQKHINATPAKESGKSITQGFNDLYTSIIDRFNPITKLARVGGKLRPGENPELLARRYLGIQGIAESKLFWNTTRLTPEGNLEVTGKGLSKILKPVKNNINDFKTLMVAQRDVELSKRVLESGKKIIGTTPKESKQVISALQKKYGAQGFKDLTKAADDLRGWAQKTLLDPLLDVGALSKEQYDSIIKSNKFYTPFQRVMEELETHGAIPKSANLFTPKSVPLKQIKGSTKDIIDPLESLITNTYKVTDFVERARVARSITELRKVSPELAEMIKPIKTKIVPVAKQGDELIFRPSFFAPDKNTIMVFENGKRKFYQVPEDVFKAVSGMMEADVGIVMKTLAYPAKLLRAGATLTPEFMGRNPIRDQFTAFVFSKYGYVPGVDLLKGIWNTVGKTDTYGKWLAGGGAHSMLVSLDRVTSQATLKKVMGAKELKGVVKSPVEALRILSEFGEKGTRVGAFGRALKKGATDLEAAFESRDITLDFARRGSQTRAVNMLVAFWNAQVQGLNKMVRAFREKPMQTTFKAVSGITLPSVLLYMHNRNDPRYQELPQWQKDLFWIVPVGDDGPIIRIPKPFEVGIIFGTVPEHILSWIENDDPEALKSVATTILEASSPGYMPTALLPIVENTANYSFFKQQPIVSQSVQNLPKEMQANRYTSETAKEIGKLIKQSPAKIENLFYGYTGGLGQYATDISDKLLEKLGVVSPPPQPAKAAADLPFLRAFVAREPIGSGSESVNKFYKLYDEANQVKTAAKELAEKGQNQQAVDYLKKHPAGFYVKGLNKVATTFSELRKKRDAVLESRDLTPEQKKRALDALDKVMTEIARQTLELVKSSQEVFNQ